MTKKDLFRLIVEELDDTDFAEFDKRVRDDVISGIEDLINEFLSDIKDELKNIIIDIG